MSVTKFSLNSSCKEIKRRKKITTQMLKRSKKMTSKWRVISMAICIQNRSSRKTKTKTQLKRKKLMKKWVKSKTNSVNRI